MSGALDGIRMMVIKATIIGKSIFSFFETSLNCFISIIRSFLVVNVLMSGG